MRWHEVRWRALENAAVNAAWVEARALGLTVAQCDLIALAAFNAVKDRIELWERQSEEGV